MKVACLVAVIAIASSLGCTVAVPPPIGQRQARERVKQEDFARTKKSIIDLGHAQHAANLKEERDNFPGIDIAQRLLDVAPDLAQDVYDMATIDAIASELLSKDIEPADPEDVIFPEDRDFGNIKPEDATLEDLLALSLMLERMEYCDILMAAGAGRQNPNWTDIGGESLLLHAMEADALQVVEHLLQLGANPSTASLEFSSPALCSAIEEHGMAKYDPEDGSRRQERSMAIIKLLIKYGADVNATDIQGQTILHGALREADPGIIRLLVAAGANLDFSGTNAFEYARSLLAQADRIIQDDFRVAEVHRLYKILAILSTPREKLLEDEEQTE